MSKEQNRLLTEQEMFAAVNQKTLPDQYWSIAEAQDAKTTAAIIEIINGWTEDEHAKALRVLIANNVKAEGKPSDR